MEKETQYYVVKKEIYSDIETVILRPELSKEDKEIRKNEAGRVLEILKKEVLKSQNE